MFIKILRFTFFVTVFVFSSSAYSGSASIPAALYLDPEIFNTEIDQITVLPIVDTRKTKAVEAQFDYDIGLLDEIRGKTSGELIVMKGYRVTNPETFGGVDVISHSDLENPSSDWIKKIGMDTSTYCLVFLFSDAAHDEEAFTDTYRTDLTAFLFDKNKGKLLWKNKFDAKSVTGNPVGGIIAGGLLGLALSGVSASVSPDYYNITKTVAQVAEGIFSNLPSKGMTEEHFKEMMKEEN